MKTPPARYLPLRAAACAVAATCAAALFAQTATTDSSADAKSSTAPAATATTEHTHAALKHADRSFIEKAAESGREEVEIARIATERATNPEVKKFAQMMVDDHTRANDELTSIAANLGVKLKNKAKSENKWSKKDAKDFDRDYVKAMVSDHKKDISLFTKESKDGENSEVVEFARKTLPTLNRHLEAVSELEKTVK